MMANSACVRQPLRRHSLAKKNTPNMPDGTTAHQYQLPEIPFVTTKPQTTSGVSAANVVATMLVPRIHHGVFLPATK